VDTSGDRGRHTPARRHLGIRCRHGVSGLRWPADTVGYARARTLRGPGAATVVVRPPLMRCAACARTHVLPPTALQPRRADTTEVIGNALIHKAHGVDSAVSPR
jgi:hypothetical protein